MMLWNQAILEQMICVCVESLARKGRLELPVGLRHEIQSILVLSSVNQHALKMHCSQVTEECRRLGVDRVIDTEIADLEMPWLRLTLEGFGCLTDEQLAWIAIQPEVMKSFHGALAILIVSGEAVADIFRDMIQHVAVVKVMRAMRWP